MTFVHVKVTGIKCREIQATRFENNSAGSSQCPFSQCVWWHSLHSKGVFSGGGVLLPVTVTHKVHIKCNSLNSEFQKLPSKHSPLTFSNNHLSVSEAQACKRTMEIRTECSSSEEQGKYNFIPVATL